eukprot:gene6508-4687_t
MLREGPQEVHVTSSYEAISTLDEPVLTTLKRDLKAIGQKLYVVVCPFLNHGEELRDWDLWGRCCCASSSPCNNTSLLFSAVFTIVGAGAAVVTLNAKLLGSTIDFFQTVCVMGYCLAPVCLGALWCLISPLFWLNFPMMVAVCCWACWAVMRFFRGTVSEEKELLVLFPVVLFYALLSWVVLVGI